MTTEQRTRRTGQAREQQFRAAGESPEPPPQSTPDSPYSDWSFDGNYEYRLYGYENQALEVNLPPNGSIQTEKGAMAWRHETVAMNTGLGQDTGLFGAIKRRMAGEQILVNTYVNEGGQAAIVGLTPNVPSHILGLPTDPSQPDLLFKKGSYMASTPGMSISIAINRKIRFSMVSRNFNFAMQRIRGSGTVFVTSNGIMMEKHLRGNDSLLVQVGHLIAMEATVTYDIAMNRGFKNLAAGGEGMFMMKLSGPGKVWLQSTPRQEEARAMLEALRK